MSARCSGVTEGIGSGAPPLPNYVTLGNCVILVISKCKLPVWAISSLSRPLPTCFLFKMASECGGSLHILIGAEVHTFWLPSDFGCPVSGPAVSYVGLLRLRWSHLALQISCWSLLSSTEIRGLSPAASLSLTPGLCRSAGCCSMFVLCWL